MEVQIRRRKWIGQGLPGKILVMRFQALGDTVITLPYLQNLKSQYPKIELHFLTRAEVSEIPKALNIFKEVIIFRGGRSAKLQFILSLLLLPKLWRNNYDGILDLQNNKISRTIRYLLFAKAWSEFDKFSPISAGERTRLTIEALGFKKIRMETSIEIKINKSVDGILQVAGWDGVSKLIVLNPAGNFASRNWPTENYIKFVHLWQMDSKNSYQFVLMLQGKHKEKGLLIKESLKGKCIDLSEKTSPLDAFMIMKKSHLVLTEDSGLMHMGWIQGIPTLAIFGSSRKD